jgi:hypothetical protein
MAIRAREDRQNKLVDLELSLKVMHIGGPLMGGYGSGRTKWHHVTDECLPIDTMQLRKLGMLSGKKLEVGGQMSYTSTSKNVKGKQEKRHHGIVMLVKRYAPGESGKFAKWEASGHLTLTYAVKQGEQQKAYHIDIPLVTTSPNYGGLRWWFLAPCCGRRLRVLYLPAYGNLEQSTPACRSCLDLHYASQQQSYVERHKAYERYLLSNYGYHWAAWEYQGLKEHYLPVTAELEHLKQRSILTRELELLHHLIAFQRLMLL